MKNLENLENLKNLEGLENLENLENQQINKKINKNIYEDVCEDICEDVYEGNSVIDYQIYLQKKLNEAENVKKVDYLEFSVAKYRFLIDIEFVQNVINWQAPYKMPFLPNFALGVVHDQQKALILVSLEKWFFTENLHHEQYQLILCCQYQQQKIAFAINQAAFYFHEKHPHDQYLETSIANTRDYQRSHREQEISEIQNQDVLNINYFTNNKNTSPLNINEFKAQNQQKNHIWVIDEQWFINYLRVL